MAPVTEAAPDEPEVNHSGSMAVAIALTLALAITARVGATALLVAIAAVQALLVLTWVLATRMPGRRGAIIIGALAAAAADIVVSVWPHGQLGTLLAVLGLALPAMIIHQLVRGAARVRVVESLGMSALLVAMVVGLPALLQLRHELPTTLAGRTTSGIAAVIAGALAIGFLVDLLAPLPRFDPAVPRGLFAVVASTGLGCSLGYLLLQSEQQREFAGGRGIFLGASLGAIAALVAVGASFAESNVPFADAAAGGGFGVRSRPLLAVVVPLSLMMPVAFLLALAIRT
jgi:hypothetical protein